jgi:transposase-like protein
MNARLSEADRTAVLLLFVAGVARRTIARKFDISEDYPRMLAWRRGLNVGGDNQRRLTDDQEAELLTLYARGVKVLTIADQFSVHFAYPTRVARRRGLPLRAPKLPEKLRGAFA